MAEVVSNVDLQVENQKLKQVVYALMNERNRVATKLVGVQNLGEQLQQKDEDNKRLKQELERLKDTIARYENRIAQLNLQLGNGPQNAFRGGIVTPGVSKKVLEALTRENTKLKLTLDHMANKSPSGTDLAVVSILE